MLHLLSVQRIGYHAANQFFKCFYDILGEGNLMFIKTSITLALSWNSYGFAEEFYTSYQRQTPELVELKQNIHIH